MKLNAINLMLYVLAKYYSKSNEYDVAHFHARGILTAMLSVVLLGLLAIIEEKIKLNFNISFFMQSKLMAAFLIAPLFLFITFITQSAKAMSTFTIDDAEQKRGWRLFWTLMAITVFLFLFSVYLKHGVIIKL